MKNENNKQYSTREKIEYYRRKINYASRRIEQLEQDLLNEDRKNEARPTVDFDIRAEIARIISETFEQMKKQKKAR